MPSNGVRYDAPIESALSRIESLLKGDYGVSPRTVAVLLVQGDEEFEGLARSREESYPDIREAVSGLRSMYSQPLSYVIALRRQQQAKGIVSAALTAGAKPRAPFAERLSRVMMDPLTGVPILLAVLYLGLYQFVGVFGAGIAVRFLEQTVFGEWLNPWAAAGIRSLIPAQPVQDLLVGSYGILTLALTYAFSIILPIVTTFFIAFSLIEDSGYLPRLAMLVDGAFKRVGLSGRAVIPIVLGFGCDTMATIVTRTQETKRERVITTLLLALAIPCSAQLGVIMAILSPSPRALAIWVLALVLVFVLIGYLASKVIPGSRASFYMELPPLRVPVPSNVLAKTFARLRWYLIEVTPIFILASVLLWAGDLTGVFNVLVRGLEPVVSFIGLPPETAAVFLFGFFRRDFGAAGLYNLSASGVLSGVPLVVAGVTLTLFVPCIAQFGVMLKERGIRTALLIALFIFPFAFLVGYLLNLVLTGLGVTL